MTGQVQPLVQVDRQACIYAMLLLAVVQVVFILSMAGIMRTMSGPGAWAQMVDRQRHARRCGAAAVPLLALAAMRMHKPMSTMSGTMTNYHLFWWLGGDQHVPLRDRARRRSVCCVDLRKAITGTEDKEAIVDTRQGTFIGWTS